MNEIVKRDILAVLNDLAGILKVKEESDAAQIKEMSNHVIHNASIFQEEDSVSIAILIYALSKVIDRRQKDVDYGKLSAMVISCITSLNKGEEDEFRKSVKKLFEFIRTVDERLKMYIHEVIVQARIRKGSKLCAHGISAARASQILGISRWELMNYVGQTTLSERFAENVSVSSRMKTARGLFS